MTSHVLEVSPAQDAAPDELRKRYPRRGAEQARLLSEHTREGTA
jgi:hypothetical protein